MIIMQPHSIPKVIHYCWFGGNPLPELEQRCIESWKKYCPDYEIMRWDETNFDVNCCAYVKEAYEAKKWAFVSDVARLYALVNYGGIYLDTDMEIIRSLDVFLKYAAVSGFEKHDAIAAGLIAAKPNHPIVVELLQSYFETHFVNEDGNCDLTTIVVRLTNVCLKYGLNLDNSLQTVNGITLFPADYFYPKSIVSGKNEMTENSYTIHHYSGSWVDSYSKFRGEIYRMLYRCFGEKTAENAKKIFGRNKTK